MKIILSSVIFILFSCNSTKKSADLQDFPSGEYEIVEFNAENFEPKETYTININVEKQYIGGKFDCNSFSSQYEKDGQNINFGFAVASKMYCEGKMQNEKAFMGKLSKMKKFEFDGETLTFFNSEDEMILKLKKQKS